VIANVPVEEPRGTGRAYRLAIGAVLLVALAAATAVTIHRFSIYIDHYPYLAVDDGLANVSYTLASHGRYGFLSSPVQGYTNLTRHRGFFNYGPWYFFVGAGAIWLFGYSLSILRSLHLAGILVVAVLGGVWCTRRHHAAAGAAFVVALLYCFDRAHWPMVRPDIAVSVFAAFLIVVSSHAIEKPSVWLWAVVGLAAGCAAFSHLIAWAMIPASALIRSDRQPAVWVVDPKSATVSTRNVEMRAFDAASVVVATGLNPGDVVVTAGVQALRQGQKVRLLETKP